jgi:simple sugar transport system permease protein
MELLVGTTVVLGMPLLLAALGGLIAERTGVLNLGLEGLMLGAAFVTAWVAGAGQPLAVALAAGLVFGVACGLALGWLVVVARADQVVTGIGLNLVVLGLTGYLFGIIGADGFTTAAIADARVPGLAGVPWLGRLFDQPWLAYVGYALVPLAAITIFRTGLGIRMRACGEYAEGARASGIDVVRARLAAMAVSGLLCGLAGAFLVLADTHKFVHNITNGRGYIALAVIILGRWTPLGALGAAALFATAPAILTRSFPPTERGRAFGALGTFGAVAAAALAVIHFQGSEGRRRGAGQEQEKNSFTHRNIPRLRSESRQEIEPRRMSRCLTDPFWLQRWRDEPARRRRPRPARPARSPCGSAGKRRSGRCWAAHRSLLGSGSGSPGARRQSP